MATGVYKRKWNPVANFGKYAITGQAPGFNRAHTSETKRKLRELGKLRVGEKGGNWRGGISTPNERARKSFRYKEWRQSVFLRDDYTCQACGARGVELQADHELPFAYYPDLRYEILNGRTLCVPCHKKTPTYKKKAPIF